MGPSKLGHFNDEGNFTSIDNCPAWYILLCLQQVYQTVNVPIAIYYIETPCEYVPIGLFKSKPDRLPRKHPDLRLLLPDQEEDGLQANLAWRDSFR